MKREERSNEATPVCAGAGAVGGWFERGCFVASLLAMTYGAASRFSRNSCAIGVARSGSDGHDMIVNCPNLWHPAVSAFLRKVVGAFAPVKARMRAPNEGPR